MGTFLALLYWYTKEIIHREAKLGCPEYFDIFGKQPSILLSHDIIGNKSTSFGVYIVRDV